MRDCIRWFKCKLKPPKKEKSGPYCIEVGRLVKMYPNCPSIDFYTIQENAKNVTANNVTSHVYDDGNYTKGNDKTYTVYAIQATVGKEHDMEFNKVAHFLQGIQKQVNEIGGESNGKEILKNSLLGGKVSVNPLTALPFFFQMTCQHIMHIYMHSAKKAFSSLCIYICTLFII